MRSTSAQLRSAPRRFWFCAGGFIYERVHVSGTWPISPLTLWLTQESSKPNRSEQTSPGLSATQLLSRQNNLEAKLLASFHHATTDSTLAYAITVCYTGSTTADKKRLQGVTRTAENIIDWTFLLNYFKYLEFITWQLWYFLVSKQMDFCLIVNLILFI